MTQRQVELAEILTGAVSPAFRGRLLDRGIARSLIWSNGQLPEGSPAFANTLTSDLLDYAYTILSMALQLRDEMRNHEVAKEAFRVAGEAIQAAVHRGDNDLSARGFHRVSAAVAFHLAGYSAMAYSIVPTGSIDSNLSPTEEVLVLLFRRRLQEMRTVVSGWLLNDDHLDHGVAGRLREDIEFDQEDAAHTLITTSFMRALALFDHAIFTGDGEVIDAARTILRDAARVSSQLNFVNHWWTCTLASHLIDDLWDLTLYESVPLLPPDDPDQNQWTDLRLNYIQSLLVAARPTIELWPSQVDAAQRAADPLDDLVIALPTSAGKTRIAELCILRTLASGRRAVYVTPLRALSAQIERDMAQIFLPLGYSVSSLYSSVELDSGDAETLRQGHIVVSTPEKLSFALRNDPSLIDDVGLIVLDEGHMLGPNEREILYEVLVESLLKREDAATRRIVSLSALFPAPEEMAPVVEWLRRDVPGDPIHSYWRPTRQRFGTIEWFHALGAARLDMAVDGQSSYVQRFIEPRLPPKGSRRKNLFPHTKNELTLAVAWQFVEQGRGVLVYCSLRKSVEPLGELILKSIRQGLLSSLREPTERVQDAINTGTEWLGAEHPAVQCLRFGVALHHARLPRPFLNEVEALLRLGECPLVIASPTLAQGLNLSAGVLLVPSIWRTKNIVPSTEFSNVSGRAGRAFVDLEGLVIHIIWETIAWKRRFAHQNWSALVGSTGKIQVVSGLLELTILICTRIADRADVPFEEVLEYITSNAESWSFDPTSNSDVSEADWERAVASLDSAVLSLVEPDLEDVSLDSELSAGLESSLFSRLLQSKPQSTQDLLPQVVAARAHHIWSATNAAQRRGFYLSGVGLRAGSYLSSVLDQLVTSLLEADTAVEQGEVSALIEAIAQFAELALRVAPFRPAEPMPDTWRSGLAAWLEGHPASDVISILGDDGVAFLQDIITYRLPWAMEAVRVHALAVEHSTANDLKGLAAAVTQTGNANLSIHTLIRSGLSSRDAARAAVESTRASFVDRAGMKDWLISAEVQSRRTSSDWPTPKSHHEWEQFYQHETRGDRRAWKRESLSCPISWHDTPPPAGTRVVLQRNSTNEAIAVLSPDFRDLGRIETSLGRPISQVVSALTSDSESVVVEFFGPDEEAGAPSTG